MRRSKILAVAIVTFILFSMVSIPAMAAGPFVKEPTNPVLEGVAAWESNGVLAGSVILDGSTYKMWYTGRNQDGLVQIGYAESSNGINWNKSVSNPVLRVGDMGDWDSFQVGGPSVIQDGPNSYKMWYTGANSGPIGVGRIGYAYSSNGINWTKNPTVVLDVGGSWDKDGVLNPSVIYDNDELIYKMWYTGRWDDGSALGLLAVGYAYSSNGIIGWTKSGLNPIMQKNLSGFDNRGVGGTYVIKDSSASPPYTMYYTGFETGTLLSEIGIATSSNGLNWTRQTTPVLPVGSSGSWEEKGVGDPSVLVNGNITSMWYTGTNNGFLPKIGYASITEPVPPTPTPTPSGVPASSNTSTFALIGGFVLLIGLLVLSGRGRFQHQGR